ncbi:non-hydrolyzing UDP-N-acetylglucosamine 2-epimerase [Thermincola potens]|uniref:UDP-N-acetylglucosamine 2-epimerase (non-hydrolyzing) n=1 Tax=Thermincola potens (strain JR) TaxID=635013 RepID=D5XDI2_THEPJ|nr:UDP-N-acetylglucosamine 2-epimerase (non-hydrolyzing) [Thermincola potens]ADG83728.1 UDP-N-acetylglucosamine 2-epimerase [Thermincola potens JR]
MAERLKVMAVFGTRPEAIKMAPLVKILEKEEKIEARVAVTAQHREMLDQVLKLFDITPDYDLDIMTADQTLYDVTVKALLGLQRVFEKEEPDIVLVHGDTTTTFVASLAAFYKQIKVGHVEAGLRTGNKLSPFPEEMNRKLTGAIADIHFAPTNTAKANLLAENVKKESIFVTGNTVIDALMATVREGYEFGDPELQKVDFANKKVLVVTTHRRENLGGPLRNVYLALKEVLRAHHDVEVVFPVHKNPKVRAVVDEVLGSLERVHLVDPLDYEPFVNLMNKSYLVLTDSGGLQEEAPSLGKPVLVLRDTTERPEAVEAGTVVMVGTDKDKIVETCHRLLTDADAYERMANAVNPYGDGRASQRISEALLYYFGLQEAKPADFNQLK